MVLLEVLPDALASTLLKHLVLGSDRRRTHREIVVHHRECKVERLVARFAHVTPDSFVGWRARLPILRLLLLQMCSVL